MVGNVGGENLEEPVGRERNVGGEDPRILRSFNIGDVVIVDDTCRPSLARFNGTPGPLTVSL